jgi:hypothetical protein
MQYDNYCTVQSSLLLIEADFAFNAALLLNFRDVYFQRIQMKIKYNTICVCSFHARIIFQFSHKMVLISSINDIVFIVA